MVIRAVVFDIGGVLEHTPDLGVERNWEVRLGLAAGEIGTRMADIWAAGRLGTITEADVDEALARRLGLDEDLRSQFMADRWREYVGTANAELIEYAHGLRPRFRTGILSNSFVGAREREQALYGFEELVDDIVYSHEVGLRKPDPRIYQLTCDRLRCEPDETVFIDNVAANVEGARTAGLHAVHFLNNVQSVAAIDQLLGA
jgi:epoxide hydrolase-like predicted phosphatase